jgi:putative transposase
MTIVDEHRPTIGVAPACRAMEVSRATWYRRRSRSTATVAANRRGPPRRLPDRERDRIVEVLCAEEFIDRSPRAVYATLLDRGQYLCSIRTMYRVLAEHRAVRERRSQRQHPQNAVPVCCAQGHNELWSWDITKLAGPNRRWFSLYIILDVFSRYAVGWLVAARESAFLATRLIEQVIQAQGIDPSRLTIHADRGSPMKAKSVAQLLAALGIEGMNRGRLIPRSCLRVRPGSSMASHPRVANGLNWRTMKRADTGTVLDGVLDQKQFQHYSARPWSGSRPRTPRPVRPTRGCTRPSADASTGCPRARRRRWTPGFAAGPTATLPRRSACA